jgi:ribosomal protein L11 methyltransferase
VHILFLECAPAQKDLLLAELWERGTSGVIEQDLATGGCALQSFFEASFDATGWAAYGARWETADDRDWIAVAEAQWEPVLVGERFHLVPAWRDDVTPPGRIRLEMQPGLACGTGWGAATQLALVGLEQRLRPGATVLDLGTGSGILAVAAVRLGAGRVCACDIDEEAARVALERFRAEGIAVDLFAGSVRAVAGGSMDLVVANINAEVLATLAPEILRALRPGGAGVLTGFPERHLARVRAAFGGVGEVLQKGEWRALIW